MSAVLEVEQYLVVGGVVLKGRELQVIRQLAYDGPTNAEIGKRLYISEKTVKVYVASLMTKTGVSTRTALAIWFLRNANEQLSFDFASPRW